MGNVQKTYLGKATGMYLAEERKQSSEDANLKSRLTAADMEYQDTEGDKNILILCPKCGKRIGLGSPECDACNAYTAANSNSNKPYGPEPFPFPNQNGNNLPFTDQFIYKENKLKSEPERQKHSPLHEFFRISSKMPTYTYAGYYGDYTSANGTPDTDNGEILGKTNHLGVDINPLTSLDREAIKKTSIYSFSIICDNRWNSS